MHADLVASVTQTAEAVWTKLCRTYPELGSFPIPAVALNNRTWKTAGSCYQETNRIELSTKFLQSSRINHRKMLRIILPHELIHQADFNLHGLSEKRCGHGQTWQKIMLKYGLPADKYHDMEIKR